VKIVNRQTIDIERRKNMRSKTVITAILVSVVMLGITAVGHSEECTFTVSPQGINMYDDQTTAEVTVTPSSPGCSFTSGSKYDWLSVTPTSGSGKTVVKVSAKTTLDQYRIGSVVIAGQEVDVTQFGPVEW
jgi:hypothetical protein